MKKKWVIVTIVAGVVVLASVNVFALTRDKAAMSSNVNTKTIKVEQKAITDTIIASGTVVAADEQVLSFDPTKGNVSDINVSVGQKVSSGTILFRYKSDDLENELSSMQNIESRAQFQLADQKQRLGDVDNRIKAAQRNKQPKEALDALNREKKGIQTEMKNGEFDRKDQQAKKSNLQKKINELTVRSTMSGTVTEVNTNAGAGKDATGSQTVVRIVSDAPYKIQGTVSEYDLVRIAAGQAVTVKAKVYPDRQWKGKIEKVITTPASSASALAMGADAAAGANKENVTSYPYSVTLEGSEGLSVGFHVNIEIQTTSKTTLVVPFDALRKIDGKEYVWVVNGNNPAEKKEVKTGVSNDQFKEIVQGVKEGDKVLANPPEVPAIPGVTP